MDFEKQVEKRLSRLESEFASLISELRRSEESRSNWESRVESKLDNIKEMEKTEWGVIISGISVLLLVGALVLTPIYKTIDQIEVDHTNFEVSTAEVIKEQGARQERIDRQIREDLTDKFNTQIDRLSNRVDRIDELGTKSQNGTKAQLDALEKQVERIDNAIMK